MRIRAVIGIGIVILCVAAVTLLFFRRIQTPGTPAGRLQVLTTFVPLYSFTAAIAGADADVSNLLPAGADPHEYAFRPSDMERLANADVLVMNGLGLENWLTDAALKNSPQVRVITASEGVAVRTPDEAVALGEPGGGENLGPQDPHVWLDPVRAQTMAKNIAAGLAAADPAHAAGYRTRADALVNRLAALDREIRAGLVGVSDKKFVSFHDAFGYFAARYGLGPYTVVETSPGKEPSPQDVARIIAFIRGQHVRAIFTEPQFSPHLIEAIAAETGLTPRPLDSVETGDFSTETYFTAMHANLATLRAAFAAP